MSNINVAIYGGSFSPFHYGHIFTVCYLASLGKFDNVFVIPVAKHAFAKNLEEYKHRYEMCRLGTQFIPNAHVSDIDKIILEIPERNESTGVNYSYHTLRYIKQLHPDWNLHFVIGADVANDIKNWKFGDELLNSCELCVIGRHGFEHNNLAILPNISSTEIRKFLKEDPEHKIAKTFLSKPIYDYIRKEKLYE